MLKSIQIKLILVFMILGIIVINSLGFYFLRELVGMNTMISLENLNNQEIKDMISLQITETRNIIIGVLAGFTVLMIIVGIVVSKIVISPLNKLIKSAQMITNGEKVEMKTLEPVKKKKRSDIDELVEAFSKMHSELQENLNEVLRQKKQIETILLHMTDGIIACNIDGNVIHINPAAKTFFDLKEDDNTFDKVFGKLNITDINMEKIIYLENWTSSERKVNINEKSFNLFFAPFKDENDRPSGVIVVIQDITEQEKLEIMRKQFVADVSHELKTPITSIMGYADTLLEDEVEGEFRKKFLSRISSEGKRMARLVEDLLTLSRYDTDKVRREKGEFDLGELVKDIVEGLSLEVEKKSQTIECFVTADVPLVYADRNGIERVVLNIITNSIKYTQEGGFIKIYVGFVYNDAYIKFIDNGIGIPEEDLKKIFERFYRVDKARTREMGGTGLGLSIVKEILDKNNGRIDIKSEYGKGTEVVVRIPTKQSTKKEKVEDKLNDENEKIAVQENN